MRDVERLRAYYDAILPYYDAALEGRGDLPFWESMARRFGRGRTLELGCGTGRVTSILSAHGDTTAVDILVEVLQRARRRAPAARVVAADLSAFAFSARFDLVVLADDPMAHLTSDGERTRAMAAIADHLMPNGRVVLEGLYRAEGSPMQVPSRNVVPDGRKPFTVEERWTPAGGGGLWNVTYRYTEESCDVVAESVVRSWTADELRRLPECGLHLEELWGDFDQQPFTQAAPRVIIVAGRSGGRRV